MIQFLGENEIVEFPALIAMIAGLIELVSLYKLYINKVNIWKDRCNIFSLIIGISFLAEGIIFIMEIDNTITDILCTVFGIILLVCLYSRFRENKRKDY